MFYINISINNKYRITLARRLQDKNSRPGFFGERFSKARFFSFDKFLEILAVLLQKDVKAAFLSLFFSKYKFLLDSISRLRLFL